MDAIVAMPSQSEARVTKLCCFAHPSERRLPAVISPHPEEMHSIRRWTLELPGLRAGTEERPLEAGALRDRRSHRDTPQVQTPSDGPQLNGPPDPPGTVGPARRGVEEKQHQDGQCEHRQVKHESAPQAVSVTRRFPITGGKLLISCIRHPVAPGEPVELRRVASPRTFGTRTKKMSNMFLPGGEHHGPAEPAM